MTISKKMSAAPYLNLRTAILRMYVCGRYFFPYYIPRRSGWSYLSSFPNEH